ncbi:NADH dehydrogenase [ubiquinone] 1 alpha subcomplex assembly factor 7 [Ancylobacter aquaticus]|uniref:NADH dehydrogenase [ubiquinone] 1 alpha subcomplex assembly factor 7 n=1 Tax=Ancylobacter aquaticus TaxID=100 RepID=A0A4R1I186_ANCAQ|nr:SAM-dependent methyltransferase [Ancylobacter aquaticus]TCK28924.1 NADH dehydrogenase [ubiquinone] 1 alpha subcomplex assembly factor 7 [Ancylobacter aquaticus]
MIPLAEHLARQIALTGPITVADYMEQCLFHPTLGYYTTREPFGVSGDFVTAPEISQMFGELLGLWAAETWLRLGSPSPFVLAELGPGRGTMMADMLRATARVPGFHEAARVVLVEASPRLRVKQAETLRGHPVEWMARIEDLPPGPLVLLANEFVDALPIRQFVRTAEGIAERMVGLGPEGGLAFGLRPGARLDARAQARLLSAPPGAVLETCPLGLTIVATLGARLAATGGAALLVDYGHAGEREASGGFGDTLQALHRRAFDDVLAHPGAADLTAHVDFAALARAASAAGARAFGPIGQGMLLERLGLDDRAFRLKRAASEADREMVEAARLRLAGPDEGQMGTLFKALALVHPALDMVAGFAPGEAFEDIPV